MFNVGESALARSQPDDFVFDSEFLAFHFGYSDTIRHGTMFFFFDTDL